MGAIGRFFRSVFSFLGSSSSQEERVAAYIVREHDRGRSLNDILADPYVRNRCSEREVARVLERPDLIKALGEDIADEARAALAET